MKKKIFLMGAIAGWLSLQSANMPALAASASDLPAPTAGIIAASGRTITLSGNNFTSGTWTAFWGQNVTLKGTNTIRVGLGLSTKGFVHNAGVLDTYRLKDTPIQLLVKKNNKEGSGTWVGTDSPVASPTEENTANNRIIFSSLWNDDPSSPSGTTISDTMVIDGDAKGYTQIVPREENQSTITDTGVTKYSDPIVTVKGTVHNPNAFYGVMHTASSANVYLYEKPDKGADGETIFAWGFIHAKNATASREETAGLVGLGHINRLTDRSLVASLLQREGQHQPPAEGKRTWTRVLGSYMSGDLTPQFGYKAELYGVQFGRDVKIAHSDTMDVRSGYHLGYVHTKGSYVDRFHVMATPPSPEGYTSTIETVGHSYTDTLAGGWYRTKRTATQYNDVFLQLSYGKNRTHSIKDVDSKSHHVGLAASWEKGKTIAQRGESVWELQTQWVYQGLYHGSYMSESLHVGRGWDNSLVGRIGLRVYNKMHEENRPYLFANVYHDFMGDSRIFLGEETLKAEPTKTWLSIGIGGKKQLNATSFLYGEVRYEHNLFTPVSQHGWEYHIGLRKQY